MKKPCVRYAGGLFHGTFAPLDVLAYAAGLLACYAVDKLRSRGVAAAA